MKHYADLLEFEKAAALKRVLAGLYHIQDVALIKPDKNETAPGEQGFRIEAYDVAHLSGKHMNGVMVVMESSRIMKGEYRLFTVRGFTASNDPGALREIITRRLKHAEWRMPDVVVVDGNNVQLDVARSLFPKGIPVVAVTKDECHKARDILGEESLVTKYRNDILLANAEAHRFAIRHLRMKARRSLLR